MNTEQQQFEQQNIDNSSETHITTDTHITTQFSMGKLGM